MRPRWLVLAVVAAVLFEVRELRADAINGPPTDCAPGSVGTSSHAGEWCEPHACQTDADCKGISNDYERVDGKCETTSLCIGKRKVYPHWRSRAADAQATEAPVAVKACGRMETCSGEAMCETATRCVVPSAKKISLEPAKRGCGCGKTSGNAKSSAVVGALVGLWLLRRNRLRRASLPPR